jgi:hypothetical protein
MRPRTETDNAQNQRREYSDIQDCINHASPSTESRLPFEVLIFRRPEIFPAISHDEIARNSVRSKL